MLFQKTEPLPTKPTEELETSEFDNNICFSELKYDNTLKVEFLFSYFIFFL